MPARASSASCRGSAAASGSPSSLRRGRCCSEPAMGARGPARAEARCRRRLQRPALPEPRSDLPGTQHSGRQGAGRDAKAEPPPVCGAGNVGARPPPPAARDYSAAGSRPPRPFRVSAPASIRASGAASASCSPPGPGTDPRGPQASAQAADTHARPQCPTLRDRMNPGRTGRGGRA